MVGAASVFQTDGSIGRPVSSGENTRGRQRQHSRGTINRTSTKENETPWSVWKSVCEWIVCLCVRLCVRYNIVSVGARAPMQLPIAVRGSRFAVRAHPHVILVDRFRASQPCTDLHLLSERGSSFGCS